MTTSGTDTRCASRPAGAVIDTGVFAASRAPQQPAGIAAGRAFGVSVVLGIVALGSAAFVITRLFESWQIKPMSSHAVSIFGQRLSYPAANAGAIIVTTLAALGLLIVTAAAGGLARELLADRRFRRALAARSPRPLHGALVIDDDRPQAFCAGLLRPRVYFSTGALELLDPPALAAVLAHERHHARCHDPLRLACGRALSAGLFFVPSLRRLVQRQHALAEISADEAALLTVGVDRSALASAMLGFSEAAGAEAIGVDPERIDSLLGERAPWRFPVALCLGVTAALSVLVALAVLAARTATGSATLAPPFLSSQPCIMVLAMIPTAAGLAGLVYARASRAPRAFALAQK
jgi:Zn-dependent protease with chaperone function